MHEKLINAAIEYDRGDPKRIQHFMKVHSFARLIGVCEGLSADAMKTLEVAAILHDIPAIAGRTVHRAADQL